MRKRLSTAAFAVLFLMVSSMAVSAQKGRASVPASEVNGTFKMNFTGKFKSFSNEVKILALGGGKLRVAMDLVYPYSMKNNEPMVNMGGFDDTFTIEGDIAKFVSDDGKCKFTIKFVKPGTIKVTQTGSDGECGFGHNVFADGTYLRTSGKKPKFEEQN